MEQSISILQILPASSFNVSVDVNTINTGVDSRDSHLKKEEYFNAEKYPTINFASTSIEKSNEWLYQLQEI